MNSGAQPRAGRAAGRGAIDIGELADRLVQGDRRALARAITLVESTRADHRAAAEELIARLMPATGRSVRLGITGTPGVGKSTFIEAFGMHLTGVGQKVAVLAVDPSSARSGGSILGDKTRMERLSRDPGAFIRPSPAGRTLGGVARRTREAMLLAEAAGFGIVLVETVGVGQSETAVADLVDMFLLLLAPAGGDELQGIKRGIMELADLIVVNKADGELLGEARLAAAEFSSAIRLMRPASPAWRPEVRLASALTGTGIAEVWEAVGRYRKAMESSGEFSQKRSRQARAWMWAEVGESLMDAFRSHEGVARLLPEMEAAVTGGRLAPSLAVARLLAAFRGERS